MKKQWVLLSAIALVLLGGWALLQRNSSQAHASAGSAAPEVTVAQVVSRNVADTAEFTGHVQPVDIVAVRPRVGGYVEKVSFKEGSLVRQGDVLFRIDPRLFQAEVDRLAAQRDQARAALKLARDDAARAKRLLAKHAIAQADADRQATAAQSAQAALAETEAALSSARLNLDFTEVRAPIDGRISNVRVTPGNLVGSDDVLTSVVSAGPVYVYFDVDEQNWLKINRLRAKAEQAGDSARIAVSMELTDESDYPHVGWLDFIDNQVQSDSGTMRLRALFANYDGLFTPGLYARVRLSSGQPKRQLLVDDRAVATDLGNQFVYVLDAEQTVQYRHVSTGSLVGDLRVIDSGLEPNDVVVVNGLQHVRPGVQVSPTQVAMTHPFDAQTDALADAPAPAAASTRAAPAAQDMVATASMASLSRESMHHAHTTPR